MQEKQCLFYEKQSLGEFWKNSMLAEKIFLHLLVHQCSAYGYYFCSSDIHVNRQRNCSCSFYAKLGASVPWAFVDFSQVSKRFLGDIRE